MNLIGYFDSDYVSNQFTYKISDLKLISGYAFFSNKWPNF